MQYDVQPCSGGACFDAHDGHLLLLLKSDWNNHELWRDVLFWDGPLMVYAVDRAVNG